MRTCLTALCTIGLTTALFAQEDLRTQWTYRNGRDSAEGHFKKLDGAEWTEKLPNGGSCTFKEIDRNDEFIEIYDSKRGQVWVRLYATMSLWKHPEHTKGEWRMLFDGKWSKLAQNRVKHRIEYHSPKRVTGVWTIQADSDDEVKAWQIVAAKATELPFQRGSKTMVTPPGKDLTTNKLSVGLFDPVEDGQRRRLTVVITHQATISARRLVDLRAGEKPPVIDALAKSECDLFLESNKVIDYRDSAFQQWLEQKKLRRRAGESSIELGRRTFAEILTQFQYKAVFGALRPTSKTCQLKEADCDSMSSVFVAAMRSNGIPARLLAGKTLRSRYEKEVVGHARAEFFVDGIGWIPVDPAFAKNAQQPAEHFANDRGDLFVFCTDDRIFSANIIGFSKKSGRKLGEGTKLTQKSWVVRSEP